MGGTKESIEIIKSLKLEAENHYISVSTTTEFGAKIAKEAGADEVIYDNIDRAAKIKLLKEKNYDVLIDATHPFASNATKSGCIASEKAKVKYIRFERESFKVKDSDKVHNVFSFDEASELIAQKFSDKRILHLAGVSTVEYILKSADDVYIRVLPVLSSIDKCKKLNIKSNHIIAMQGTFSCEFNMSLMKELACQVVVTKEAGKIGGAPNKIKAAQHLSLDLIIVNRPQVDELNDKIIVHNIEDLKKNI